MTGKPISPFAWSTPKWPRSFVQQLQNISNPGPKKYRFSFQGSSQNRQTHGQWLKPFVKSNFGEHDYLLFTDVSGTYEPMGMYDHSKQGEGFKPKDKKKGHKKERAFFDKDYFEMMSNSRFTLCPGGEAPWSMRFYEAVATKSIPVIDSVKTDLQASFLQKIPYKYVTTEEHQREALSMSSYNADMAEHNFQLFLKYQTFMKGDNVP